MQIRYDRITRAQALMVQHGLLALMIVNHDDYRYFFGEPRVQPRAIVPAAGPPILIAFAAEEAELRQSVGDAPVKVFRHVGEQISSVRETFRALFGGPPPGLSHPQSGKPRIGMQLWFDTPAFLVDMFRKLNPQAELVSSDPVMDALRMVKEPEEMARMRQAQAIAALGMDRARELLRPGANGHAIATEVLAAMMRAGAEGTSTPIHINPGPRSCWIHGRADREPIQAGWLVVVDLTPQYEGYCGNLARSFVLGTPAPPQQHLLDTYRRLHDETAAALRPGTTMAQLDALGKQVCTAAGLGEYHLNGISHGVGLRFEETPAPTIMAAHRAVKLVEGMTVTVGHTVLAVPGTGGVRFEDVYRVTAHGGECLHPYPVDPVIADDMTG